MRLEWASLAKPGKAVNEDLVVAFDEVVAVLDGASVPASLPRCCERDAAWYVARLGAGLVAEFAGQGAKPLADGLAGAIRRVTVGHKANCTGDGVGPSAALAIVRFGEESIDYLVLGDCTVAAQTDEGVQAITDDTLSTVAPDIRARIRQRLADGGGYEHPDHAADVAALVEAQRAARNQEGGYWIAAEDLSAPSKARRGKWSSRGTRELTVLSDGAARLVDVFGLHADWGAALRALSHTGASEFVKGVRHAEASDESGANYPRTSAADDATVVYGSL